MFGEELVDRVRRDTGLGCEYLGGGCGRGDAEHGPAVGLELRHRRGERGGLARPRRADHQHQVGVTGHPRRRLRLRAGQPHGAAVNGRGRIDHIVGGAALRPRQQPFLLSQDCRGGEGPVDRRLGDRSTIAAQRHTVGDGAGDVDAALAVESTKAD